MYGNDQRTDMDHYLNAKPGGAARPSFFRRHWFLSFCCCCLGLIVAGIFVITEGRPLDTALSFLNTLTFDEAEETAALDVAEPPADPAQALEDKRALWPAVNRVFAPGAALEMRLYSEAESTALKSRHPALADNKGYFTRLDGAYLYVSNDGRRIYHCEITGELLIDKMAREAQEAAELETAQTTSNNRSVDETGVVIYSPSAISGGSLDQLTKDPSMKGIFRDADGTWRNY